MAQQLTNEIIDAAIEGFEAQKRRIDAQIAELRAMRTGSKRASSPDRKPRKKMSAAGRRAIAPSAWPTYKFPDWSKTSDSGCRLKPEPKSPIKTPVLLNLSVQQIQ